MVFDPDKFLKETAPKNESGAFDPDKFLAETAPPAPQSSALEAGITGFGKGASFGYLPQIEAATEPLIQGVMDKFLPSDPEGFNVQTATPQTYTQRRDAQIKGQQQMAEEHPTANLVGELGGGLASGIATGGAIGKLAGAGTRAATFGGRLAQAAKTGATVGLVRNPGDIEGEISPFQPTERIKNAASDAATGMVLQGGLEGLGKVASGVKNAGSNAASFAEKRALSAAGAMKKDFKLLDKLNMKSSAGRAAIDEGIIEAGDGIENIAEKVVLKKNDVGDKIGQIYKAANDELKQNPHLDSEIDLHKVLDDFEVDLAKNYKGKAGGKKVVSAIKDRLDDLRENPEKVDLDTLFEIRQDVDREARKLKAFGVNQETDVASELKNLRNKIQEAGNAKISDVDQAIGSNYSSDLKVQNKRYSNLKAIEGITKDGLSRADANRIYGLSEQIGTMAGTIAKGPVVGVGLGLANRMVKKYGDSVASVAADKVSKILSKNPGALGKFASALKEAASVSPEKFTTTIESMMEKPEFKKALEAVPERGFFLSPTVGENKRPPISRSPSQKFTRSNP